MIKQGSPILLSKRLKAIADMIPEGQRLADVGCDHGFLSIYLVQTGKIPGALAMDVRKGPLAAAALHVKEAGLEKQDCPTDLRPFAPARHRPLFAPAWVDR